MADSLADSVDTGAASAATVVASEDTEREDESGVPVYFLSSRAPNAADVAKRLEMLCYAIGVLCRRALYDSIPAGHNRTGVNYVYGFYQLFRGDVNVLLPADNAVLDTLELRLVIRDAVRLTTRLFQDHFVSADEYDEPRALYKAITAYERELVVLPETDPRWTAAMKEDRPTLLSMRRREHETTRAPEHSFVTLNMRYSKFRMVKLNRESVRGFWAAQQQELIYIGNRNDERGSIQQMRATARNLITQACDLPVGYPIYVSPLTTSYTTTPSPLLAAAWQPLGDALRVLWATGSSQRRPRSRRAQSPPPPIPSVAAVAGTASATASGLLGSPASTQPLVASRG